LKTKLTGKCLCEIILSSLFRVTFLRTAGVQLPPVLRQHYRPEQWLERLAKQRVLVRCQLLARQVPIVNSLPDDATFSDPLVNARKRKLLADKIALGGMDDFSSTTALQKNATSSLGQSTDLEQIALCRITYRPSWFQLFSTDIAESLVRTGNANVSPLVISATIDGDGSTPTSSRRRKLVDSSQRIHDLRNDVKYLDWLAKAEFQAAKESMGMWSVPEVRASKAEIIEDVEFQTKANSLQKLWRWLRGG
jgi:hypothetical protein